MVGALQPVTPMVQHLMYEGSLTELLTEPAGEMCTEGKCDMDIAACSCDHHQGESDQLLDIDYYPVPLHMGEQPSPLGINQKTGLCCSGDEQTLALHYQTDLPPPR
ncbi:hypothetical protein DDZ15_03020 [Rhodohalobacter mucosus]|uniref:Uncharacterized protein n=2 Tax=Rhodohalobacter mucosus TaxID=2079485 RepID=A0A316TVM5_9BACT|nr:hypothetical protein DDZ15_03020 [Rhodohalobacter mucosus]